ncbi:hypothetical protein Rmet_3074 [Cupriavidus metallidurans CH34]|uniref:Uncharacterized protein n=1 Tax=Cupriavidus metallidurans (strain ATCC 43123 / DSM 2839 / NBRC 102507 / CH34) TaxID=266264 RepID=Q1LIT0_CUPMC|nr:hypothetical protein Rmet_3074 [Cupriavidus metallidurans CH34]
MMRQSNGLCRRCEVARSISMLSKFLATSKRSVRVATSRLAMWFVMVGGGTTQTHQSCNRARCSPRRPAASSDNAAAFERCAASGFLLRRMRCRRGQFPKHCGDIAAAGRWLEENLGTAAHAGVVARQNPRQAAPGGRLQQALHCAPVRTQTDVGDCGARHPTVDWRRARRYPIERTNFATPNIEL